MTKDIARDSAQAVSEIERALRASDHAFDCVVAITWNSQLGTVQVSLVCVNVQFDLRPAAQKDLMLRLLADASASIDRDNPLAPAPAPPLH